LEIINEVITESVPEDGIVFDPQSISIEETQIDADYQGIRVKVTALLESSRIPVQIDIGFSDEFSSKAEAIEYPNILPDLKAVQMKGYPKEAVVAEKFHAMVRHAELNSRMKDYYDLWLIAETFEFKGTSLQKAVETTFKKRDTELPLERPTSLTVEFASMSQTRWATFLRKMNMDNEEVLELQTVIEKIWKLLEYPLQSSINKTRSTRNWLPRKGWK
jgi:hypothetical protein